MPESRIRIISVTHRPEPGTIRQGDSALRIVAVTHTPPATPAAPVSNRDARFLRAVETAAAAVRARRPSVRLPGDIDPCAVKECLRREHPEFYLVDDRFRYIFEGGRSELFFTYRFGARAAREIEAAVDREVGAIVAAARRRADPVEQLRYVYDWFACNLAYDHNSDRPPEAYTPVGVFLRRRAVCDGFARAFMLICRRLGIECGYILGKLAPDAKVNHAWNIVWLNGCVYHIDPTSAVSFFEREGHRGYVCFLQSAEEILRGRVIEGEFPRRDDPLGTYLARLGCRFNSPKELTEILRRFYASPQRSITLQAGERYAEAAEMTRCLRDGIRRLGHCDSFCYYENGVCLVTKADAEATEIRVVKVSVL